MATNQSNRLGDLLIKLNYVTEEQINEAIQRQKEDDKKLGELLVDMGYMEEKDLIKALDHQLGVAHINLADYILNPQLASYIPENIARRHQVIPIKKDGDTLKVAMTDPNNLVALEDIEITSGMKVEPMIGTSTEIKKAISQIYSLDEDTTDIIASLDDYQEKDEPELDRLREMVEDAPIVRLTNLIIGQAIQMRASDIHIEPQAKEVRVRYRIDGVLRENMTAPHYSQAALISRLKIMADLDITKRRVPQDGRVAMNVKGVKVDMRVSTLPTIYGEKIVIRILTKDENLLNIDQLGFSSNNLNKFRKLIEQPHGILLVTGPTGSGKTTTLFAALNHLNTPTKNIVTIEDPVEYQIDGINQIQANPRTGLTFASTLRSILRQDPDIVMVGEIRDEETAKIAVRAALTGHLVLSTLHTNDSFSSITRLLDMGIPSYLVASTVIGSVAQRLVRKLCDSCKKEYYPGIEEREILQINDGVPIYRAESCEQCSSTGYRGRLAVQEVLMVDKKIREMVVKGAHDQEIKDYALDQQDMKTLRDDGVDKVKAGITSMEEMVRVII